MNKTQHFKSHLSDLEGRECGVFLYKQKPWFIFKRPRRPEEQGLWFSWGVGGRGRGGGGLEWLQVRSLITSPPSPFCPPLQRLRSLSVCLHTGLPHSQQFTPHSPASHDYDTYFFFLFTRVSVNTLTSTRNTNIGFRLMHFFFLSFQAAEINI